MIQSPPDPQPAHDASKAAIIPPLHKPVSHKPVSHKKVTDSVVPASSPSFGNEKTVPDGAEAYPRPVHPPVAHRPVSHPATVHPPSGLQPAVAPAEPYLTGGYSQAEYERVAFQKIHAQREAFEKAQLQKTDLENSRSQNSLLQNTQAQNNQRQNSQNRRPRSPDVSSSQKAETPATRPIISGIRGSSVGKGDTGLGQSLASTGAGEIATEQSASSSVQPSIGDNPSLPFKSQPPSSGNTTPAVSGDDAPQQKRWVMRSIDPWSAFKTLVFLSVALFVVWIFAVGFLYGLLTWTGIWSQLEDNFGTALLSNDGQTFSGLGRVLGAATFIGLVGMISWVVLCSLGVLIFNLSAKLSGGIGIDVTRTKE